MHASINFLNGRPMRCLRCNAVLTTYEEWQKHQHGHGEFVEISEDQCEPTPAKKSKHHCMANNTSSILCSQLPYDKTLSPEAGPSHLSQIGHGSSHVEPSQLHYSFEKVGQKTFKNGVIDRHYRVKFSPDQRLNGQNLASIHRELEDIIDDVIHQARSNLDGNDLGRLVLHHPN